MIRKRPLMGVHILDDEDGWGEEERSELDGTTKVGEESIFEADEVLRRHSTNPVHAQHSNWGELDVRPGTSEDEDDEVVVPRRPPPPAASTAISDDEVLVPRRPAAGTLMRAQVVKVDSDSDADVPRRPLMAGKNRAVEGGSDSDAEVPRRPPVDSTKDAPLASTVPSYPSEGLVYRDSQGRRVDIEAEMVARRSAEASRAALLAKQSLDWNVGAVQKAEKVAAVRALELSAAAPFTRTVEDVNNDATLRARAREGDPMAMARGRGVASTSSSELTATGKPVYRGPPAPPNRYSILPGYRWDGVDRGTGWEKTRATFLADSQSKK